MITMTNETVGYETDVIYNTVTGQPPYPENDLFDVIHMQRQEDEIQHKKEDLHLYVMMSSRNPSSLCLLSLEDPIDNIVSKNEIHDNDCLCKKKEQKNDFEISNKFICNNFEDSNEKIYKCNSLLSSRTSMNISPNGQSNNTNSSGYLFLRKNEINSYNSYYDSCSKLQDSTLKKMVDTTLSNEIHCPKTGIPENNYQQFGFNLNIAQLIPNIETIKQYRKNAKKSNDPTVLFQYAKYMLEMTISINVNSCENKDKFKFKYESGYDSGKKLKAKDYDQSYNSKVNDSMNEFKIADINKVSELNSDLVKINTTSNVSADCDNIKKQNVNNISLKNNKLINKHFNFSFNFKGIKSVSDTDIDSQVKSKNHTHIKSSNNTIFPKSFGNFNKKKNKNNFQSISDLSDSNMYKIKKFSMKEALYYLKKLSDKGYINAKYLLADAYSSGALDKIDNKEAFSLFQAAAKHGHVESSYRTFYSHEKGIGTKRDARKAIEYLKMAASKNHPAAMFKLGLYSFYGKMGLSSNINTKKMGIKWLTRAVNIASPLISNAPYELGKIYFEGFKDIVIADKKYAIDLYKKSASLGHVNSSHLLGKLYETGEFVKQDSNLSIKYYTEAALSGHPESMLALCAWFLVGNDLNFKPDKNQAFQWLQRAASYDFPKAHYILGLFYEKGIGCEKNIMEAQNWYEKAEKNGFKKAIAKNSDKKKTDKQTKTFKKE